jgi:hypothetical protein
MVAASLATFFKVTFSGATATEHQVFFTGFFWQLTIKIKAVKKAENIFITKLLVLNVNWFWSKFYQFFWAIHFPVFFVIIL